jgi:hypothetical protein
MWAFPEEKYAVSFSIFVLGRIDTYQRGVGRCIYMSRGGITERSCWPHCHKEAEFEVNAPLCFKAKILHLSRCVKGIFFIITNASGRNLQYMYTLEQSCAYRLQPQV